MFAKSTLKLLSLMFNDLHNELRYFEEINKTEFIKSNLYEDLKFFQKYLDEIYHALIFFGKIHEKVTFKQTK